MNKAELQALLKRDEEVRKEVRTQLANVLEEVKQPISFNWEDGNAPSYASTEFDNDLADSYVTKIWFDRGLIKVNLHAYYLSADKEDIDLADETCVDYADLLDYVLHNLPDGFGGDGEPITPPTDGNDKIVAGSEDSMESINVFTDPTSTPRMWESRVKDTMACGHSREEAEKMAMQPIELELFYEDGYGMFAVEKDASESSGACRSPYTGKEIVPFED